MKFTVLKINRLKSKMPDKGDFFYVFVKGEDGCSYKTCLYPKYGNFKRCGWDKIISAGVGTTFEMASKKKGLLDADVPPRIVKEVSNG